MERDLLAQHMETRRQELRLTWDQVAVRGSITAETLRQVRIGDRPIRPLTKRAIEEGLDWPAGTVDAILTGLTAQPLDRPDATDLMEFIAMVREVLESRFTADTKLRMIGELVDDALASAQPAQPAADKFGPSGTVTGG